MSDDFEYPLDEERANKAYETLVKYLAASARSEQECKNKLYDKGFHRNEVEFAIDKAKGYKHVDDAEYVRTFLFFNKTRYGARKIAYKLTTEKGVSKQLVNNIIADTIDDEFEIELCQNMAQKFVKSKKITDKSGAQKVGAHLFQKGFEWNIINNVMSNLFDVFEE